MRILFSTVSPARYMAPPLLGDEQVNCGPDWVDEKAADGRWRSLHTPIGEYNLATIAAKLSPAQQPDLVVCLIDASWRNLPRGLAGFKCPRILLVADTHHLQQPLIGMLRYATSEPFTRIVLLYDRHHAAIFRSAGIRNLFWFPGLTFPHGDAVVRAARQAARTPRIAFVGQTGKHHPRRARLIEALTAHKLPVAQQSLAQGPALGFYGSSLLGFNASLNGDLNLRVFEILASGGALLTDRLAPESGLAQLFTDGRELLTYGSPEELAERAADALAHRGETKAIGAAGARWFDEHFGEKCRRERFDALAFDGQAPPEFAFSKSETTKKLFSGALDRLVRATVAYEKVQELHRTRETVRVAMTAGVEQDVTDLFATLPRVQCNEDRDRTEADLVVISAADAELPSTRSTRLWCCDAQPDDSPALEARLASIGAVPVGPAYFRRKCVAPAGDSRKHILLYTDDPESGGVAQYNHALLLGLADAGYRVSCVQSSSENPLIAKQRQAGVRHFWIDYHSGREFARTLTESDLAEEIFCEDPPDLVVFSDCCPVSNLAAREVARRHDIPYLIVVGFVGAYLAKNFAQYLPLLARQQQAARAVVAVSEENRELLQRLFGTPPDRCEVIHYGRPQKFFRPADAAVRARLRRELKIPEDGIVCLTTARLTAIKGFQHQFRAMEHLRGGPAFDRLYFVWAGDGDQRKELEQEIARRELGKRVHLLGHRWDVADWYDAADIFVLSSHLEGMPLSIMEAMAKGLPVIASAVSGIPEELGDTGHLLPDPGAAPDKTAAELGRVLAKWALDSELRVRVGERARERAQTLFREELMVSRSLKLVSESIRLPSIPADAIPAL
jgi:glycosyltransferase involved in cell wall biosynthesis